MARLPEEKVREIRTIIHDMLRKSKTNLKTIQSLVGYLNFACRAIPPGRTYVLQAAVKRNTWLIKTLSSYQNDKRDAS